ncbi:MAG TPA: UDP-N-acetylglucosamine 2-epimerase (non-hydrolyzing) [Terriglobales bacterium]|jgi:UDP-N-acetylglucosamine 2-epimerase (non-hydrolysing)|nr:UDP-N-acetylglucosamine 2-epimerase (non-hydrolyzing) [Terriglobales bacterium]
MKKRIGIVFGTRPDAIKMAPVVLELRKRSDEFIPVAISTGQHRQMLDQVLQVFDVRTDIELDLMRHNQTLNGLTRRILESMDTLLAENPLDCLLVQGDTTTAFAAALAAFYRKVPVAHVEAGLRSHDIYQPWPEEVNRRLASVVTQLHFAPTPLAAENLLTEAIPAQDVVTTGNTIVDAVYKLLEMQTIEHPLPDGVPDDGSPIVLMTSHRRESWGVELENICDSILELVERFPHIRVIYPVHLNPNVTSTVEAKLSKRDRIHLIPPVDYFQFLSLLRRCHLVLTDSGGVQEEAPIFHKPVLVLRKVTERPEASLLGMAKIVGTSRKIIVREASRLLSNEYAYKTMAAGECPYGDGLAAERIATALSRWLNGERPVLHDSEQFQGAASSEPVSADSDEFVAHAVEVGGEELTGQVEGRGDVC